MKISEAILYIINKNSGSINIGQFNEWLKLLSESGHLELDLIEVDGYKTWEYSITEKGLVHLNKLNNNT